MLKLEVLISAMNQNDLSIADRSLCDSDVLIINQTNKNSFCEADRDFGHIRMLSTTERGLSRSRNMAINMARADICLFCDDDEILDKNYHNIL